MADKLIDVLTPEGLDNVTQYKKYKEAYEKEVMQSNASEFQGNRNAAMQDSFAGAEKDEEGNIQNKTYWDNLNSKIDKMLDASEQSTYEDYRSSIMRIIELTSMMSKAFMSSAKQAPYFLRDLLTECSPTFAGLVNEIDRSLIGNKYAESFLENVLGFDQRLNKVKSTMKVEHLTNLYTYDNEAGIQFGECLKDPVTNKVADEILGDFKTLMMDEFKAWFNVKCLGHTIDANNIITDLFGKKITPAEFKILCDQNQFEEHFSNRFKDEIEEINVDRRPSP